MLVLQPVRIVRVFSLPGLRMAVMTTKCAPVLALLLRPVRTMAACFPEQCVWRLFMPGMYVVARERLLGQESWLADLLFPESQSRGVWMTGLDFWAACASCEVLPAVAGGCIGITLAFAF